MSDEPVEQVPVSEAPFIAGPAPATPRRHRVLFWTAVLLALGVAGGGSTVAVRAYADVTAPEQVVLDYLGAVASGDAAAALAYGDLPDEATDLLTTEVLAAQLAIAPITGVTVNVAVAPADTATAKINYQLGFATGAQAIEDTIPLVRDGRTWRLAAVAIPVIMNVSNGSNRATLAGAEIPFGRHLLFPGALPIAFDTENLGLNETVRTVRFAQTHDVQEVAELTEAGTAAVGAALDAALAACLDGSAAAPTLCPLPDDARAVPGSLKGTVETPASETVRIATQPGNDGRVLITGEVTVTGEYQQLDFNNQRVVKTGDLVVEVEGACFATAPDLIIWRSL